MTDTQRREEVLKAEAAIRKLAGQMAQHDAGARAAERSSEALEKARIEMGRAMASLQSAETMLGERWERASVQAQEVLGILRQLTAGVQSRNEATTSLQTACEETFERIRKAEAAQAQQIEQGIETLRKSWSAPLDELRAEIETLKKEQSELIANWDQLKRAASLAQGGLAALALITFATLIVLLSK